MYDILISIARSNKDYAYIMKALDGDRHFNKEPYRDLRLILKYSLTKKWKGEKCAQRFMLDNLQVEEFRVMAIKDARADNDVQRAYQLALDGIAQAPKDRYGNVPIWYHWMLNTAQIEGNTELITKYASLLYLEPFDQHGDFYGIIKETVPAEEWKEFSEALAQQAIDMGREEKYAELCSREKWYDKLME